MIKRIILLTTTLLLSTIAFAQSAPTLTLVNNYGSPLYLYINNRSTVKMLKDFNKTFILQPGDSVTSEVVLPNKFLPVFQPAAFVSAETIFKPTSNKLHMNEAYFGVRRDGPNNAYVEISGYLDDNIGYYWNPGPNGSETVTFHQPYSA